MNSIIQPSQIQNVNLCLEGKDIYTAKEPESILDWVEKYMNDIRQSLQAQIDAQKAQIDAQQAQIDAQQAQIEELRSRLDSQQSRLDNQLSRLDSRQFLISELQDSNKKINGKVDRVLSFQAQIDQQQSRLDEQQTLISELQESNEKIHGKVDRVLGLLLDREDHLVIELGKQLNEIK